MSNPDPKKPFVEPRLVVYGDIQKLTNAIGMVGGGDSGTKGTNVKTR